MNKKTFQNVAEFRLNWKFITNFTFKGAVCIFGEICPRPEPDIAHMR